MFYLLRKFFNELKYPYPELLIQEMERKYVMLRFADMWYHLGWVLYYEQAFVDLRRKWEAQAYDPENLYRLIKKHILRK